MDLGADGFQTFRYVVLPKIATALLAGGMLAFALSFDEVIVTTFTAGQQSHPAHLDAHPARAPPAAPGHQRGGGASSSWSPWCPSWLAFYLTRDTHEVAGQRQVSPAAARHRPEDHASMQTAC